MIGLDTTSRTNLPRVDKPSRNRFPLLVLALLKTLFPLLLALAKVLSDLLGWRVLNEVALLVEAGPLGQTVRDVDAALAVEHVESSGEQSALQGCQDNFGINVPGSEVPLILVALELDQRREQQDHVPALVHDGAVAERAADLARQLVFGGFGGRVVPLEVVVAVFEVDVVFVEDGGPLERCGCESLSQISITSMAVFPLRRHTMLSLASSAMAQFAV
jgi:hypothetical protein